MRYSKSAIAFASLIAALWAGSIALLIGQLDDPLLRPFAIITAIVSGTATIVLALDRAAARYMSRDTRPPIVVHADWNPDLASRTTFRSLPAYQRVVSIPVPVLSTTGDGDTTLGLQRSGGTTTRERDSARDDVYWQAYSDLAEDVLCGLDQDPWD